MDTEQKFDQQTEQVTIHHYTQIDSVLATLEAYKYRDLPKDYIEFSGNNGAFKRMVKTGTFYRITKDDFYKKIVGNVRICNFLAHDNYYQMHHNGPGKDFEQYWLIDKKLLYRMLDLQKALSEKGYDPDGFYVRDGHRYPVHNEERGGASRSQHIAGKATDIIVQDINKDGQANQKDKQIVLDLLEDKIIKNKGGVGRYPGSMVVHFDVRGHRARWDQQ